MKLDSRILEGKKPLDCFDVEEAKQFIGKKGYFCDHRSGFTNISNLVEDVLRDITPDDNYCEVYKTNCTSWEYFLPKEWIKESEEKPEKKYRAFSLNEFLEKYDVGDLVKIRRNGYEEVEHAMFTGYITDVERIDDKTPGACEIMLGIFHYSLLDLFKDFELFYNGEWQPFGVIDQDKE